MSLGEILCIIDGMTDDHFRVEDYPNLHSLPQRKRIRTVPEGRQPESLTCILTLLGYQNVPYHLRGYADALGAGIEVQENDLILRTSWVKLSRDQRISGHTQAPSHFSPGAGADYYHLGTYKGLLVLPGQADCLPGLSTYPPYQFIGASLDEVMPVGSDLLSKIVRHSFHIGSCLLPWGQSRPAALSPFDKRAAVITATDVVKGIARMTGMDIMPVSGTIGETDTNLVAKAKAAIQAADDYPFVLLHINGADEASHRLSLAEKQSFLRKIDRVLIPRLTDSPHKFTIVSDHSTDPFTGLHDGVFQEALTGNI